jgi:thiamine pyrophosphokinase
MVKNCLKYHVNDFLQPSIHCLPILPSEGFGNRYNLILLNSGSISKHLVEKVWQSCELKVCADGGGNRLFDEMCGDKKYIPNSIVGDLDSVRPEVAEFYSDAGSLLVKDDNEDLNDLDKCLQWIDIQTQVTNDSEEQNDHDIDGASDEESLSPSSHGRPK